MFHPSCSSKLVIISANHNHLPPLIVRNENGTVTKCLNRSEIKQRREKPTLGPRATRYEVDRLLARIKHEMEFNRKQPTKPTVEAEVASNNNSVAPRIVVSDLSSETRALGEPSVSEVEASTSEDKILMKPNEELPKIKNDPSSLTEKTHQNEFASYVYHSATNRHRAVVELMASNLGSETRSPHSSVVEKLAVSHEHDHVESSHKPFVSLAEENIIVAPTGVDEFIKQESSLQDNPMFVIFPPANSVAGNVKHNRFTIPSTQNRGNILYNNNILISPVKTEPNCETSVVQAKRNELYGFTGNIVNKDGNTNKMFMIVRPNDGVSTLQNNENVTKVNDKVTNNIVLHNKHDALALATDALSQPNKNTAVSSSIISPSETTAFNELKMNKLIVQKTASIPISSMKNINLPPTFAGGSRVVDERGNVIPILPITIPKRTEAVNMLCKKAHSIMPMKINMMTQTLPSNLILEDNNIPVQCLCNKKKASMNNNQTIISSESCKTAVNKVVKTEALTMSDKIQTNLLIKMETEYENFKQGSETGMVSSGTEQPTASKQQLIIPDYESQIIQSALYSKQPIVSTATKDTKASKSLIDNLDWIVPRNKGARAAVQTKINTNIPSKYNKQMIDNAFNLGKTSNIPEISIPVSMIPLPNESSSLVTTTVPKTVGNNERGLASFGTPVVMIERLSMKHKAGHLSMYSVPPKKRHYQP